MSIQDADRERGSGGRRQRPAATPSKVIEHLTTAERARRGKDARAKVPRHSHGEWEPRSDRPDPVGILQEQARTRVPELVPIRYGRMLVSPFAFYRGAAALMASDLADSPRTGLDAQLCGDAHLSNFGAFAAPDRRLIFGLNDFDETLPGPFEWDVKRLMVSFEVAGRDRGFDDRERGTINTALVQSYRKSIREFGSMRTLDLWYARFDVEEFLSGIQSSLSRAQRKRGERNLAKTRAKDSLRAFSKLTRLVDGRPKIASDPPLIVPIDELVAPGVAEEGHEALRGLFRAYRQTLPHDRRQLLERFRYVDAARKVVGVGSVGTRAWIVLMLGRDNEDPLFLQAKEAEASVLEPHLGKSGYSNHGQRVVEGQRMMQAASDIMLGWLHTPGLDGVERDFYIRQLWDAKGSVLVDEIEPPLMETYARVCGWTLAKAHARSGDAVAIGSYLGSSESFDRSLLAFGDAYADQNERDYEALKAAADSGRIVVQAGL